MIRTSPIVPSEFFLKGLSLFSHLWTVFAIGSNRNVSGSPFGPFGETNLATHEVISYGWVEASVNSLWSGLGWRQGGGSVFTGDFAECHKFTDPVRKGTSSAQSEHS